MCVHACVACCDLDWWYHHIDVVLCTTPVGADWLHLLCSDWLICTWDSGSCEWLTFQSRCFCRFWGDQPRCSPLFLHCWLMDSLSKQINNKINIPLLSVIKQHTQSLLNSPSFGHLGNSTFALESGNTVLLLRQTHSTCRNHQYENITCDFKIYMWPCLSGRIHTSLLSPENVLLRRGLHLFPCIWGSR